MNPSGDRPPPYRVVYSEACRAATKQLLERAALQGRFAEIAQAVRDIDLRLRWIPLDLGEPLRDHVNLEIREYVASFGPLVVRYGADESRRVIYVSLPFGLLRQKDF